MKKIIATVLAMVMALALCTTAMADTKTAFGDGSTIPTYDSDYSYELKAAAAAYDKNVGTFQVFKTTVATKAVAPLRACLSRLPRIRLKRPWSSVTPSPI